MIVSLKDGIKLISIAVVVCTAVFVCNLFLNFYIDVTAMREYVYDMPDAENLYNAQVLMAKFICAICGGVLAIIAVVMLIFYVKIYIDGNLKQLGIFKALGFSNGEIAIKFWVFGLSVFIGAVLGYLLSFTVMPTVYKDMTINIFTREVDIKFHPSLLIYLIILPTAAFSALSCLYALFCLKKPVIAMLKGADAGKFKFKDSKNEKSRSFTADMIIAGLHGKKSLVALIAIAGFCFSAMIEMSFSMNDLSGMTNMNLIILIIGIILSSTIFIMSVTAVINANSKSSSLMKTFGYGFWERYNAVFGGYRPFAYAGFALGTVYQFGLMTLMVNVFFKDVENVPEYGFNVPAFFITLAIFIALYEAATLLFAYKMDKISVKQIMVEN